MHYPTQRTKQQSKSLLDPSIILKRIKTIQLRKGSREGSYVLKVILTSAEKAQKERGVLEPAGTVRICSSS